MSDENHSLEELQKKAKFLREEKQRIIKAKREQEAIKKLQAEIDELKNSNPDSRSPEELLSLSKKNLNDGISALKQAGKKLLDSSQNPEQTQVEKDLEEAKISGLWPDEETLSSQNKATSHSVDLEQKWEKEKLRLREEKALKQQEETAATKKAEQQANEGCLVALGALAWFIPFLWPIAIIQLFKTYPKTCFTVLGIFAFLVVIISASLS